MGPGGEVLQKQRIHRAFEANMKLGDFGFSRSARRRNADA
jgi:hypothetical protein